MGHLSGGVFAARLGRWGDGKQPMYRELAATIRSGIKDGLIQVGSRLPAERVLAESLAVSRTTVATAYSLLEDDGWVERRRGSGTTVVRRAEREIAMLPGRALWPNADENGQAPEGAIEALLGHDPDGAIDLTVAGFQGDDALPVDMVTLSPDDLGDTLRSHVGYLPAGLPALRERVAESLTQDGLPTEASQILITGGAHQGLALLSAFLLESGDAVVLENPTYYGAIEAFRDRGARLAPVEVDHGGVDVDRLVGAVAELSPSLIYVTPTCNNPTGSSLSHSRRWQLARLAERTRGIVLEDLAPSLLSFDDEVPRPIAALTDSKNVITIGSIGKLFWPGLRVGWVRGPVGFINCLIRAKAAADLGTSLPSQCVALRLLPEVAQVRKGRTALLRQRLKLVEEFSASQSPAWELWPSAGGLYAWLKLPAGDADHLVQIANRHGVTIMPGRMLSVRGSHVEYLRLSLAPDPETLAAGLRRLADAWKDYDTPAARRSTSSGVVV